MLDKVAQRLGWPADELRRAAALALILGGITSSYTLTKTARDAHFLSMLPASALPYVFLGVGVVSAVVSVLFSRATRRRTSWENLAGTGLVAAISLAIFAQFFRHQADWVPIAFYLWVNVYGLLLVTQFWLFANHVCQPREARRTFGLVGLGGVVGGLLGGLLAGPLAHQWSLTVLLYVAALLQVAAVLLVRTGRGARSEEETPDRVRTLDALRHPYVRWLALAAVCSVVVSGVLDYQFKIEIQRRYPTAPEMASFLGLFYTVTNLAALLLQALGARWLMERAGAAWSAALLPAGLGIGSLITILVPGFGAVAGSRLWDQVTRNSVARSAGELFYFPLEPGLRRKAKALIGAGLERLGDGLAGLVILLVALVAGDDVRTLAVVVAVLVGIWLLAWAWVRRGYVGELGINLRRMNLVQHESRIDLREAGILAEMERLLNSPYERIVLHGIDLLEEHQPEAFESHLDALLDHGSPAVRARTLRAVRGGRLHARLAAVEARIQDEDQQVRVEALGARATLLDENAFESMEPYLTADDARVRAAAILSITEHAPCDAESRVGRVLDDLLERGGPEDRVAVAEALGRRPAPCELHDLLTPLLVDADLDVRRAALRSAGHALRRPHIPVLIEALGVRATEEAGRAGLVSMGERVVGTLGDYIIDPGVPAAVRHAIPRVLGELGDQEAVNALFRSRDHADPRLAYRILKAANRVRATGRPVLFPRDLVSADIERDVRAHLFAFVHYRSCPLGEGPRSAERMLCVVLNERMEQALNRVFRRLGLLYPPQDIEAAYQGVIGGQPRARGSAIEYLENALAPEHRSLVLPLVDDNAEAGRLRLAAERFDIRPVEFDRTLALILAHDDEWLRVCALFVAGRRRTAGLLPMVESQLTAMNALVRETARWARVAIATG